MVDDVDDFEVIEAMTRYGGSFIKHIGEAASCADMRNMAKIKAMWTEEWNQYASFVKKEARKNES